MTERFAGQPAAHFHGIHESACFLSIGKFPRVGGERDDDPSSLEHDRVRVPTRDASDVDKRNGSLNPLTTEQASIARMDQAVWKKGEDRGAHLVDSIGISKIRNVRADLVKIGHVQHCTYTRRGTR